MSYHIGQLWIIEVEWCTYESVTVYPKKYAHGYCFAVLCCGYTLTDFPKSIRLTSLALWQSSDCPSASKATLMNMDKYLMWIHYERLRNHNKQSTTKPCAYFLGYTVTGSSTVQITICCLSSSEALFTATLTYCWLNKRIKIWQFSNKICVSLTIF